MHRNLKIAVLALACLAVVSNADTTQESEDVDTSLDGYDHHLYARNALEEEATNIKAEFGEDVDTTLDGYDHHLYARNALEETAAAIKAGLGADVDVSLEGYDEVILGTRDTDDDTTEDDKSLAVEHAQALAADDEDYDKQPDGVDDDTYLAELADKDAKDDTIPVSRRDTEDADFAAEHAKALAADDEDYDGIPDGVSQADYEKYLAEQDAADSTIPVRRDAEAEAEADAESVSSPSAAEKKRLGRMRPHYVNHAERMAGDLKNFMKRYADSENGDEEVDISLEGYDHDLVRRESADSESVDESEHEWEEPQEELKGYDHSKLLAREAGDELSEEEKAKYLKEWNSVVARDFEEIEDEDDEDGNDRYVVPEDTEAGTTEKRGAPSLKSLRKGVKVTDERALTRLQKLRKGVKVMFGYEG